MSFLPNFGTNTTYEELRANQQTIAQIGEEKVWDGVASMLDAWNKITAELLDGFVEKTTIRLSSYGGGSTMKFQITDEFGVPDAQKKMVGSLNGYPLRPHVIGIQYTGWSLQRLKAAQIISDVEAVMTADKNFIASEIKSALFAGTNYDFTDYMIDHQNTIPLPIRALINADGTNIPPGPAGQMFDGATHNHYLATTVLTNDWLSGLLETVIEHYTGSSLQPVIYINRAEEAEVTALEDFKALVHIGVQKSANQEYGVGTLDTMSLYDRQIGWFQGAEVWVKEWMVPSYIFCYIQGAPPPLRMRIESIDPNGGEAAPGAGELQMVFDDMKFPLRAKGWQRNYGMGCWNRTNGAIGYIGGADYVAPDPATL